MTRKAKLRAKVDGVQAGLCLRPALLAVAILVSAGGFVHAQEKGPLPAPLEQNRVLIGQLMVSLRRAHSLLPTNDVRRAQLENIAREAQQLYLAGKTGQARRLAYKALATAAGHQWTARDEFWRSLMLRLDTPVCDPARPLIVRLAQIYETDYRPQAALKAKAALLRPAGPRRQARVTTVKELGAFDSLPVHLIDQPFCFAADLREVPDGNYLLRLEVYEGDGLLHQLAAPVTLAGGFETARGEIERRLSAIEGHDSAKASIRYPFDFALRVNLGWVDAQGYDFTAALQRSRQLLTDLGAGRDPVFQATGRQKRHYWFAEAGEIMPYGLFVPARYDGQRPLPLIVALHGMGGNEEVMLGGENSLMIKLAVERGYIVASPLGYRRDGGYGRRDEELVDPQRERAARLSEQDVMNVLELVRQEYRVDTNRIYLMGHSMGGGGTWRLGAKYPELWAALAPIAAGARGFGTTNLVPMRQLPVLVCHGDADPIAPVASARALVSAMKALGMTCEYFEKPGGTHAMVVPSLPRVFDFFDRHAKPAPTKE
jgi:dienelactone hydrolase